MFFRVLGPFEVLDGTLRLPLVQRRLLAALVVHANAVVSVDTLVDALWGETPPVTATASLQSHLSRLRSRLATSGRTDVRIATTEAGYRLQVPAADVDAVVLERHVEQARDHLRHERIVEAIASYDDATSLWRGPAWAGLADEHFLQVDAVRLDELRRTVAEERARALLAAGRAEEVVGELEALLAEHPLREGAVVSLVTGLYRTGRTADALATMRSHRRRLADELGVDPSPEFVRLERDVLSRAHTLDTAGAAGVRPEPSGPAVPPEPTAAPPVPERKLVSVLMVARAAPAPVEDPEDHLEDLQPLVDAVVEAVHRHGGSVQSLRTDVVVALFGAPQTLEDHAVRACRAALDVQAGAATPVCVAVRTGDVLLREVTTDLGRTLEPVGPTIDATRMLLDQTSSGTVRICATTARLSEGFIDARGRKDAADRELVAVTGASSFEVRVRDRMTRFVGRRGELALLRARLVDAAAGHGQVLAIVGEAGVGKSRLAMEVRRGEVDAPWTVLTATASPYDTALPYQPLANMVRRWLAISETTVDATEITARLTAAGLAPEHVPELVALATTPTSSPVDDTASEHERRGRLHQALIALVAARGAPTLLVVEDLQWADRATIDAIGDVVDAIVDVPVGLLVTYRPEHVPPWIQRSHVTVTRLRPLGDDEAHEMLDDVLGHDPSLGGLRPRLLAWTGGSPLFIEETVRDLVERDALVGAAGDHRLAQHVDVIEVPASLRAVVGARVDRLAAAPRTLLQLAAVLGPDGPLALLGDLAVDEDGVSLDDLTPLHAAEFLVRRLQEPEEGFAFRHAIIRDTVYGQLSRSRRRQLHDRAVEAIRRRYGDRPNDHTARLAEHAFRAERWEEAAGLLRRAGDLAIERSAHHDAAALWEQSLRALRHVAASPARDITEIETRAALRPALVTHGRMRQALGHLQQAERLARGTRDRARLAWILVHTSYCHDLVGTMPPALAAGREALGLAEELRDGELQAEARLALCQALAFAGDATSALEVLAPSMRLFTGRLRLARNGMAGVRGTWAAGMSALAHAELGDLDHARELATLSLDTAVEGGRAVDASLAHFVAGSVELSAGDPERAATWLRDGVVVAEREIALAGLWCRSRLADALVALDDVAGAQAEADRVVEAAVGEGLVLVEAWGRLTRAVCLGLCGRPEQAVLEARRAGELARANGLTSAAARASHLLAGTPRPTDA